VFDLLKVRGRQLCVVRVPHFWFSSALLEQELPRAQLVQALFGFNIGVEVGQLAIVACIWPLLQWLRRRDFGTVVVDATSFAGAAAGTFALVVRVFG
jgi:hypothetical protein